MFTEQADVFQADFHTSWRRVLPVGFQTVAKSVGKRALDELDAAVKVVFSGSLEGSGVVPLETAVKMLELAYENLTFEDEDEDERRAHVAVLEHLSKRTEDANSRGNVI